MKHRSCRRLLMPATALLAGMAVGPVASSVWAAPATDHRPTAEADALQVRITQLIEQLGDDRFAARERAERELLAIGRGAFDQLKAAESFPDPEIAARARFLARQLVFEWAQPDDPAFLREWMSDYGRGTADDRKTIVDQLAPRPEEAALTALCRIVRYDEAESVSRYAAIAVAQVQPSNLAQIAERRKLITAGIGRSKRTAARWLQTYLLQFTDPQAALAEWREHTIAQRAAASPDSLEFVLGLLRQQAMVLDRLGRQKESLDKWYEMFALDMDDAHGLAGQLIRQLIAAGRWAEIDRLVIEHRQRLRNKPSLLYLAARARLEQEDVDKAEKLADLAFSLTDDVQLRLQVADQLSSQGHFDWANREFREVIDKLAVESPESAYARTRLATILFDHQQFEEAVLPLGELLEKAKSERAVRELLDSFPGMGIRELSARCEFYRACHHEKLGQPKEQRVHLEKALEQNPEDIDVVIAMHRLPGDESYRKKVRAHVARAAKTLEREISRNPDSALQLNNWAWLIANTEGDFTKALKRAQRAVELADEDSLAGHLDTLARCYFTAGDLENAIGQQKRSIELDPHTKQLQRQLAEFETAIAEKTDDHE